MKFYESPFHAIEIDSATANILAARADALRMVRDRIMSRYPAKTTLELAQRCGVKETVIGQILAGSFVDDALISKVIEELELDHEWLNGSRILIDDDN